MMKKPYASPTTHFEVPLSSGYNLNRLRDSRGNSLLSSNRLAHSGVMEYNVNDSWSCISSFTYDLFLMMAIIILSYTIKKNLKRAITQLGIIAKGKRIIVKRLRNRWGSMTKGGSINLNVHLLKVLEEVIDYIILHELCI